jgi:prepilin-type N-terminal cleavage/methylation domain-containing protein
MTFAPNLFQTIPAKARRGFSLIELMVAISIMAILIFILLDRLYWYEGQAEKASMEHTAEIIKSGLWMASADLMMAERNSEIAKLAERNPILLLAREPANYLGEINANQAASVEAGNWFYDAGKHQLVILR